MNSVHPEGRKCRAVADWNNPTLTATGARHSERNGAQRSGVEESLRLVFLAKVEIPRPFDTPAGRRAGFPSVARNDVNW